MGKKLVELKGGFKAELHTVPGSGGIRIFIEELPTLEYSPSSKQLWLYLGREYGPIQPKLSIGELLRELEIHNQERLAAFSGLKLNP